MGFAHPLEPTYPPTLRTPQPENAGISGAGTASGLMGGVDGMDGWLGPKGQRGMTMKSLGQFLVSSWFLLWNLRIT